MNESLNASLAALCSALGKQYDEEIEGTCSELDEVSIEIEEVQVEDDISEPADEKQLKAKEVEGLRAGGLKYNVENNDLVKKMLKRLDQERQEKMHDFKRFQESGKVRRRRGCILTEFNAYTRKCNTRLDAIRARMDEIDDKADAEWRRLRK